MKKLLITLACLSLSAAAFAQVDPDIDSMGIYFDQHATTVCSSLPVYSPSQAYVCLTNASSASGISGFEFHVDISPPPPIPPSYILPPGTLNVLMPPTFVCGLASPLPWAPSIVMVTIAIIPLDFNPIYFTLSGVTPSSFGGPPGYADGDDPGYLRACGLSAGGPWVCAIANAGPDCGVVATEIYTWGSVKSIFR